MRQITRRQVLTGAALAAAAGAAYGIEGQMSALANVTVGPRGRSESHDALVVLFLRGGADGLNIIIPHGDDDYYRLRPTIGLPRPNDKSEAAAARTIDLDGFFGLHPALAPMERLYHEGTFAAIHAIGSGDQTRSHFEAMATMERGLAADAGSASGWLARHLAVTEPERPTPLRAVAVADTMPDSLRGAAGAVAMLNLNDFRLNVPTESKGNDPNRAAALSQSLKALYADAPHPTPDAPPLPFNVQGAGRETLDALDAVKRLDPANYRPAANADYPKSDVGNGLRQVACLVKGHVGLEVACLDMGGWDSHVAQGRDTGIVPRNLSELGKSLAAFAADLGPDLRRVTVLVMTEFGRRAYENYGYGTDHGRGSMMLALGGNINGGRVYANWPGLAKDKLEGPGDLRVTTDYRDILAEVLTRRAGNTRTAEVFSGFTPTYRNLVR